MNILIIGSGNIGFELAKNLTWNNNIFLVSRSKSEYIQEFLEQNKNAHFISCNALDRVKLDSEVFNYILSNYGKIDILVSTVGIPSNSTPLNDFQGYKENFSHNLMSNIIPAQLYKKHIRDNETGRLIVISASSGHHAPKRVEAYSPAKWALENYLKYFRKQSENISTDVVVIPTLKNKYSRYWTQKKGIEVDNVIKQIAKIIERPQNKRHFIPSRYFILRFIEKLFPFLLDIKYLKVSQRKLAGTFKNYKLNKVLILGASNDIGKNLAKLYSLKVDKLYLFDNNPIFFENTFKEIKRNSNAQIIIKSIEENENDINSILENIDNIDLVVNCINIGKTKITKEDAILELGNNNSFSFLLPVHIVSSLFKSNHSIKKIINVFTHSVINAVDESDFGSYAENALWSWSKSMRRVYGRKVQVLDVLVKRNHINNSKLITDKIVKYEQKGRITLFYPKIGIQFLLFKETLATPLIELLKISKMKILHF